MSHYQEPEGGYSRKGARDQAGRPIGHLDVIHMDGPEAITVNAPGGHADITAARYVTEQDVWRCQGTTTDHATIVAEASTADPTYLGAETWGQDPAAFHQAHPAGDQQMDGHDDGL